MTLDTVVAAFLEGATAKEIAHQYPSIRLVGADDATVLEWAAQEGRVLITHDVTTVTRYANERVASGKPMPGVLEREATLTPTLSQRGEGS